MQLEKKFVFPGPMHPSCCNGMVWQQFHIARGDFAETPFSMLGRQKCSTEVIVTLEQIFPTYLGVLDGKKGEGSSQSFQVGQTQSPSWAFLSSLPTLTQCPLRSATLHFQAPQCVCKESEVSYHNLLSHRIPLGLPARPRANTGQT